MRKTSVVGLVLGILVLTGCDSNGKLEKEIAKMQGQSSVLQQDIEARDKYIDEVIRAVNQVYKDLEVAKTKEAKLLQKTQDPEGQPKLTSKQMRQMLLDQISAIGSSLRDNRKRIASLQQKLKASDVRYASLDEMVQNLKQNLEQREQSIAILEARITGLESTVAENTRTIKEKDGIIEEQKNLMNTVYYVVGKKSELKKKGIISEEGGILWGLLGSTTVLSSGIDKSQFKPFDWTRDQTIQVEGTVDEIIPRRKEEFFALAQTDEHRGDLTIKRPDKFWQDRYLVIVVD